MSEEGSEGSAPPTAPSLPTAAPAGRRRSSLLRKALRWTIGGLLLLLLLAGTLLLFKDSILRSLAEQRIRRQTGLEASIGQLKVGLGSATMALQRFIVYNPPRFGGSALISIPELYLELDSVQTARGKLGFKEIRLNLAEVNVVKDKNGVLNVEELRSSFATNNPSLVTNNPSLVSPTSIGGKSWAFGGIQKLTLTLGRINLVDLQQPRNNQVVNVGITNEIVQDIRNEEDFKSWMASLLLRILLQELNSPSHPGWKRFQVFLDGLQKPWELKSSP